MKTQNVLLAIGVIFAGVVFQSLDIVSGWTNILTIAGAVIILLALQKIPQVKFNIACKIFLVWFIFSAGFGMVWKQIAEKAPMTTEALSMRSEQADIIYGERTRPKALSELTAMSVFTEEAAHKRALLIVQSMNMAHTRFLNGSITKEEYDVQIANFTAEAKRNKEWRERQSSEILSLDSNPQDKSLQERLEGIGNTPGRVVMWGLMLILLAAMVFSAWKTKAVMKHAVWAVVLIGMVFVTDRFAYGDAASKLSGLIGSSSSTSTLAGARSGRARTITANYTADKWTRVNLPTKPLKWESSTDIQLKLADGRIIDAPKDQYVKLGKIPGSSILVRGPAGKIVFTIM